MRSGCSRPRSSCAKRWRRFSMAALTAASPRPAQVETLEKHFHAAALHRRLSPADGQLVWSWSGVEQQAEIPLWKLAQAASDLLVSSDAERVKDCGDPSVPLAFSGYQQESHPAMVRYEDLRQPDEGATTPGTLSGGCENSLRADSKRTSGAKALICGLLSGTAEAVPFQQERLPESTLSPKIPTVAVLMTAVHERLVNVARDKASLERKGTQPCHRQATDEGFSP